MILLYFLLIFCATSAQVHDENFMVDVSKAALTKLLQNNDDCSKQLLSIVSAVASFEPWAIKMIDASSKLQSGLITGSLVNLGDFDECLAISANTSNGEIRGMHCLAILSFPKVVGHMSKSFYKQLRDLIQEPLPSNKVLTQATELENMIFINSTVKVLSNFINRSSKKENRLFADISLCLPASCTVDELNSLFDSVFASSAKFNGTELTFIDKYCQTEETKRPDLDTDAILSICFFALIGLVMLISTFYDYHLHYHERKPPHEILIAFSVYTNGKKLFNTSKENKNELPCLNGIRTCSIVWIVLGHTYMVSALGPVSNMLELIEWTNRATNRLVVSADFCVDTFLLLSGTLLTYNFMLTKKEEKSFNLLIAHIFRFCRIMSVFMPLVLMYATLLKYFGTGPWWPHMHTHADRCRTYWWTALLNIQNYYNDDELCVSQSWYLSMDMQMFTVSLLLLYPLWKWPKVTLLGIVGLFAGSAAWAVHVAWKYKMHGLTTIFVGDLRAFYNNYYNATLPRAGPYLIGLLLGYTIYKQKLSESRLQLNKVSVCLLWIASLSLLAFCMFIGFCTLRGDEYKRWAEGFYISLIRPGWALAVSWIIFACTFEQGGAINKLLSLPTMRIMGRLSFSIYIVHGMVLLMTIYSRQVPFQLLEKDIIATYLACLVYSVMLSVVWTLAFEFPTASLINSISGRSSDKQGSLTITKRTKVTVGA